MKITFLGTGADTAYPLPFCLCKNCTKARELGGRNLRKRSSIVINKDLIVDLGPDVMSGSFMHGVSIADIRYCLETHSHSDHFDPSHLSTRVPEYAGVNTPPLKLYASETSITKMSEMMRGIGYISNLLDENEKKRLNLEVYPIKPMQTLKVGNYDVTAFKANHDKSMECLLYAVEDREKTIFYGTDTDELPEETWKGLQEKNLKFDAVILDHTYGPNIESGAHLNANAFEKHIKQMRELNILSNNAQIFATHISHEGNPIHPELEEYARVRGYKIAYDGLVVEV